MKVHLRKRKLTNGAFTYYLDYTLNYKRVRENLKITVEKNDPMRQRKDRMANAIRAKKELQLLNGEHDLIIRQKSKDRSFIQLFEAYLRRYTNKNKRILSASLNKFKEFLASELEKEDISLIQLDSVIAQSFADFLSNPEKSQLSGETPYDYFQKFKQVLIALRKQKIIQENPASDISLSKKKGLHKSVLTTDEISLLNRTECDNPVVKKAFIWACLTGQGYAEIKHLKWDNIQGDRLIYTRRKVNQQVTLKIHDSAFEQLPETKGTPDEYVWDIPSDTTVSKHLKRWVNRAGIDKHITFYCARHSFACNLLINGANLKTVADCMGHTSTQHTLKYLNYVDSLKDDAIMNLPNI